MASGGRKARVFQQDLPPVIKLNTEVYGYLTRHRVIAEDRNRFSAWSPVLEVPAFDLNNQPVSVPGSITVNGDSITVVWGDAAERPKYDIFVSFNQGAYEFHGTSPIHTYSFLKEAGATEVDVAIQIESINKERSNVLTISDINAIITT